MTISSAQLRNTARFGTPLRAEAMVAMADQQDALVSALARLDSEIGRVRIVALNCRPFDAALKDARDLLLAHGRAA